MFVAVSSMMDCSMLRFLPATIAWSFWSISQESACRPPWTGLSVKIIGYTPDSGTHQLVQHDQQTNTSELHGIAMPSDYELAHPFRLQTRPPSGTTDAVRERASRQGDRAVNDSNMGKRLRGNVVETPPDLRLQTGLRGRRVQDVGTSDLDYGAVLAARVAK